MAYDTDERLKSYLDTNQLHREQLCRAVLAIDKRFANVQPRHPRGGPDGGRDIEADFRMEADFRKNLLAFGAVGFVNQANDSSEQKKIIKGKFSDDLQRALSATPKPNAFGFFTNINLTIGEKNTLVTNARAAELTHCEIFDRERIRIALDEPDGFALRFQYLGLSLSEAEQASFFAKWGDDIQSIVSTGFQRIEETLDRMLFLQEAADVMKAFTLQFELDRTYSADEIGHFRAFCLMYLKEPKHRILAVLFGSSDRSNRMRDDLAVDFASEEPGIKHGIGGGQWEKQIDLEATENDARPDPLDDESEPLEYTPVGWSSSIGMDPVEFVTITYNHDHFIRLSPRLILRDIDESSFMPMLNSSLAEKVRGIRVYSNGYKLQEISEGNFRIDSEPFDPEIPANFSKDEVADSWVRIRPTLASAFNISFADQTPRRLFFSRQTPDNLAKRRNRDTDEG